MSAHEDTPAEAAAQQPFLSVVRGAPTDEELAALVVVLSAAGSGGGAPEREPLNKWGQPTDLHRQPWGMPTSYLHRG